MVDFEDVYERFIIKINKNAQTDNIQCDRARFVEIYNENSAKWLEWTLKKRNDDDIRYAQVLHVPFVEIKSSNSEQYYQEFKLPEDYFDLVNTYATASSECCEGVKIDLYEAKSENVDMILQDEFESPSFDFRESSYYIASNKIIVFKKDFTIDKVHLSYYRYPVQVALKNPDNPESGLKAGSTLLDNKAVNRIISMCASDFALNNDNQKYQAENQRVVQKF